jgi:hypothetical protein
MIIFEYDKTDLPNGFYVVEFVGNRSIAEYTQNYWNQPGADYDRWQFEFPTPMDRIVVIARIDPDTLTITEVFE